jgi:hypothetical protein
MWSPFLFLKNAQSKQSPNGRKFVQSGHPAAKQRRYDKSPSSDTAIHNGVSLDGKTDIGLSSLPNYEMKKNGEVFIVIRRGLGTYIEARVTRCVFEKVAHNVAPFIFCENYYKTFTVEKEAQLFGVFL